ncbi:MAG TPA: hypothetical protein VMG08_08940 [Allosphingosinicella sp.]|nr:hypothetical protein [Allosphingosinicella sp.]
MARKTTTGTTGQGKKPAARKPSPKRTAEAAETLPLDLPPPEPIPAPETAREEIEAVPVEAQPLPDALGLTHTSSPVDLPEPAIPLPHDGLKWTTTVMAVTALFLLVFNATALRGWAYELTPTDTSAKVVSASEGWYDLTAGIGLNKPVDALHHWWRGNMNLRFPGQEAAAPDVRLENDQPGG